MDVACLLLVACCLLACRILLLMNNNVLLKFKRYKNEGPQKDETVKEYSRNLLLHYILFNGSSQYIS